MWWKKILFTLTFSVYCFIFYSVTYYILDYFNPALLRPETLSSQDSGILIGIFTGIVLCAFIGANYVIYGNASGRDE